MLLYIYTDGASRSNPGESASGYSVFNSSYELLLSDSFYNGINTNNVAEYLGIIRALERVAKEYGYDNELEIYSDSKLIINQLNGNFKVKSHELKKLNLEASEILKKFATYKLNNLRREDKYISEVDRKLNMLLDEREKLYK